MTCGGCKIGLKVEKPSGNYIEVPISDADGTIATEIALRDANGNQPFYQMVRLEVKNPENGECAPSGDSGVCVQSKGCKTGDIVLTVVSADQAPQPWEPQNVQFFIAGPYTGSPFVHVHVGPHEDTYTLPGVELSCDSERKLRIRMGLSLVSGINTYSSDIDGPKEIKLVCHPCVEDYDEEEPV